MFLQQVLLQHTATFIVYMLIFARLSFTLWVSVQISHLQRRETVLIRQQVQQKMGKYPSKRKDITGTEICDFDYKTLQINLLLMLV